jgi:hypothetical protein
VINKSASAFGGISENLDFGDDTESRIRKFNFMATNSN